MPPRTPARRRSSASLIVTLLFVLGAAIEAPPATACTTVLVGRALTADGSVLHAHNEDMGNETVGRLWHAPAAVWPDGATVRVPYVELAQPSSTLGYWASGNALGAHGLGVDGEVRSHDSVLVGMNERGVTLSCNWAHSREPAATGRGVRRYALRQLLLERAESARQGVELLGGWIERHGQADWGGLVYHLADPREAWVVETTTRHWVARRVRDDEIRVTANRFRIGSDYDLASAGLAEAAAAAGWIEPDRERIDFAAVYGQPEKMNQPYDTVREERAAALLDGLRGAIGPEDLLAVLRDRYEGTSDFAPPQPTPVWREDLDRRPELARAIATNLAQSSFVAHLRPDLPVEIGALLWLGLGTPTWAGYLPLYAGASEVPSEWSGSRAEPSDDSAWWLFRRLQRAGDRDYWRRSVEVTGYWAAARALALQRATAIERRAIERLDRGDREGALALLSAFTRGQAQAVLLDARRLLDAAETRPPAESTGQ